MIENERILLDTHILGCKLFWTHHRFIFRIKYHVTRLFFEKNRAPRCVGLSLRKLLCITISNMCSLNTVVSRVSDVIFVLVHSNYQYINNMMASIMIWAYILMDYIEVDSISYVPFLYVMTSWTFILLTWSQWMEINWKYHVSCHEHFFFLHHLLWHL